MESRLILAMLSFIGLTLFLVPSVIIGNGLSLTIQDNRSTKYKYFATAQMIRTAFLNHHLEQESAKMWKDSERSALASSSMMLTRHIALSARKRMPDLNKKCMIKLNYKHIWNTHLSGADKAFMIDKLLYIKQIHSDEPSILKRPKSISSDKEQPQKRSISTTTTSSSEDEQEEEVSEQQRTPLTYKHRFNFDLEDLSSDNAILLYNMNLIEDCTIEMKKLIDVQMQSTMNDIEWLLNDMNMQHEFNDLSSK